MGDERWVADDDVGGGGGGGIGKGKGVDVVGEEGGGGAACHEAEIGVEGARRAEVVVEEYRKGVCVNGKVGRRLGWLNIVEFGSDGMIP